MSNKITLRIIDTEFLQQTDAVLIRYKFCDGLNLYGFRPLASLSPPLVAHFGRVRHTHHGAHGAPFTIPRCLRLGGLLNYG